MHCTITTVGSIHCAREFGIDFAKWVDVEPVSVVSKHVPPSGESASTSSSTDNQLLRNADGPIFRDGRRLTGAKGLT
jgi:hypothetical protein